MCRKRLRMFVNEYRIEDMENFSFTNTIIESVIGVVGSLVVAYAANRKTTEESSFFSYITLSEEKFVKKKKQISNILMIVFLILYLIVGLSGMLYSLPINESVLEQARIVGISVLPIMMIGQIICNFILAFSDIKQLDEKMQKQKKDLSDMDEEINLFITVVECNMLKIRTELIREGKHSEDEIKEAINSSCVKIKTALNESLNNYLQVLSEELIDDMNGMLFDNMLYMISIRANGSLANKSLEKILQDQGSYNLLWKRVDKKNQRSKRYKKIVKE